MENKEREMLDYLRAVVNKNSGSSVGSTDFFSAIEVEVFLGTEKLDQE